ncbi:MAG: acetate kinase [Clostridia bacterium]
MKILVINAGSSTIKYQLFNMDTKEVIAKGLCERIGQGGLFTFKANGKTVFNKVSKDMKNHLDAVKIIMESLTNKETGVLSSLEEINAVGHRIVQGAEFFTSAVLIDAKVLKTIEDLTPLAPLHQPAHASGIKAFLEAMPSKPNVAVFDTVFHSTIPDYAYRYALPKQAYTEWNIRKYGFHGSSHKFVAEELEKMTGKKGNFIICHLGNGCSVSAVSNGKCIDTSMGYTPLEGVMMGTRCGDVDATVVQAIMEKTGKSVSEVINYLNKQSGLLGVSGVSGDIRDLEEGVGVNSSNQKDVALALKMFAYRIRKYIGSYMAVLGKVDAIAFTAGIGENDSSMREKILVNLETLGIEFDANANNSLKKGDAGIISTKTSKVKIFVIPTNEELEIANETLSVVTKLK